MSKNKESKSSDKEVLHDIGSKELPERSGVRHEGLKAQKTSSTKFPRGSSDSDDTNSLTASKFRKNCKLCDGTGIPREDDIDLKRNGEEPIIRGEVICPCAKSKDNSLTVSMETIEKHIKNKEAQEGKPEKRLYELLCDLQRYFNE